MRGHSHDVARTGYVNLLQPQDRKSVAAGDTRASVEARAALLARGVGLAALDAVAGSARSFIRPGDRPVVVDLGSGGGDTLGLLASTAPIDGIGIDLSTSAAMLAARRFPALTWVVANADRRLPLLDRSTNIVLSVHARRNPAECHRILRTDGRLIVAIPAATDLIELREAVQGSAVERDRLTALMAEHAGLFEVVSRTTASQRLELEREALLQVLRGTYRGERISASPRVQALEGMHVTFASEILVMQPKALSGSRPGLRTGV